MWPDRRLIALAALGLVLWSPGAAGQPGPGSESGFDRTTPEGLAVLSGQVVDRRTGAPLPFAAVSVGDRDLVADAEGRFALFGLAPGEVEVVARVDGYRPQTVEVSLALGDDLEIEIALRRLRRPRNETVVLDRPPWRVVERSGVPSPGQPGVHRLSRDDVEDAAGGFGDPLRALLQQPGVTGDEGSRAWFQLRGGLPSEVRVEVDGIPLRHPTHTDGVVSVFDRGLLDGLALHASGTPVDRPGGLSGGLYASYLDGPGDRLDGAVDLSLLAGSAHVALRAGRHGRSTFVVGARRSFLGLYLQAASAAGAFDRAGGGDDPYRTSPPRVDYGEYLVRYRHEPNPRQELRVTVLATHDRMLWDDANVRHRLAGGAIDWRWEPRKAVLIRMQATHASSWEDAPPTPAPLPHPRSYVDSDHRTGLRLSTRLGTGSRWVAVGGEVAARTRRIAGDFDDVRTVPAWVWLPHADLAVPGLELDSTVTWPEAAVWARAGAEDLLGPLELRVGMRVDLAGRSGAVQAGPRLEVRLPLPSGTTISAVTSLVNQERTDALVVDRDAGEPGLHPERAAAFQLAVEQVIGDSFYVGLTGWHRELDRLVVFSSDDPTRPGSWTNDGHGRASGLEVRAVLREGRFGAGASYGLSVSRRTNPHAFLHPAESAAGGDPRHAVRVDAHALLGRRRGGRLGIGYAWRSGWAIGTLEPVPAQQTFRWSIDSLDGRRRPDLHRIAVRFEQAHEHRRLRLVGTVELAATPGSEGAVEDCPSIRDERGDPPACRTLDFLPVVMPWVGLRAEF